ncbi:MAG: hypothetical protein ACYC4L_11095 [Chloroflexota bacterium]
MDTEIMIGAVAGLLGVGLAIGVAVGIPLGWFNRLLAVRANPGAFPLSKAELLERLLALNDEARPWQYRLTPDDPRADLVAEWKLADARWWALFARSGFKRTYRAFISLDGERREVRVNEESSTVSWSGGVDGAVPQIGSQRDYFRGVILFERSRELAFGVKEIFPMDVGKVYDYDFDPWRVKGPLLRLAVENGWHYCPVVMRSQLGRKRALVA